MHRLGQLSRFCTRTSGRRESSLVASPSRVRTGMLGELRELTPRRPTAEVEADVLAFTQKAGVEEEHADSLIVNGDGSVAS